MGVFIKLFITILCISILLSIAFPDDTQFLKDNLFSQFLIEETDPITGETYYSDINETIKQPEWEKGGTKESSGNLRKFFDVVSITKRLINTLINIAVVPIYMAIDMDMPGVVRLLIFIPLALLYIISIIFTFIRGVPP